MNPDNRIPSVIRDFAGRQEARDVLSFLAFQDWFAEGETEAKDWIVAARSWRSGDNDQFTFSVLASATENSLKQLLSNHTWEVQLGFDKPSFYGSYGDEESVYFDLGTRAEIDGVELRPFTIHRHFHGYVPTTFELVQNFLLYHEAFFVPEQSEYHRIDNDGNLQSVARFKREGDNHAILVDAHHLKDYLAACKCYLVRYHDHRRWAAEDISKHIGSEFVSYPLHSEIYCFDLWLRTDIPREHYISASRLLGKDVVLPYPKPDKSRLWLVTGEREEKFATFIIDRDKQGQDIETTCSEDELSNYFVDRGTPHFLTPVFFKREVLAKYYQEPKRYTVSGSGVKCLSLWSIPIDITDEDLVQVWLGDLGRIPYTEQLHWRQFNIAPKGTITRHRWLRDFMAEFADPDNDPVYYFHVAFEEVQREVRAKYQDDLFTGLDDKDKHAYETLHLPLTEEWKEFDEQVQALAKITVDSLNVALLSHETGQRIDGVTIKGSLDLLKEYLKKIGVLEDIKEQILYALHAIQTIRSTGAAHRKGSNFEAALKRFQLDNLSNRAKVRKLLLDLTRGLSLLANAVREAKTS